MPPDVERHPLARRLAAVRRRLRLVAGLRGVSWLVTTVVLCVAGAGLLDWWAHVPDLVGAVLLGGALSAAGLVAYRGLVRPFRERSDDLSLALRIEAHFPELNDCLASTVQFLKDPDAIDRTGSPVLRKAAVRSALLQTEDCDFTRVVDRRGIRVAGVSLVLSSVLGVALLMLYPGVAWTALARLAAPFGGEEWPAQTHLELTARSRLARGDVFELRGTLEGVIPDKATVSFWFEGTPPTEQAFPVVRKENGTSGTLSARLEPSRVQRTFRYRVRANDALSPWREVVVLPPPTLIPLDGRPSPRLSLTFPAYTDLPPQELPDGAATIAPLGNAGINGALVAGTSLKLDARIDRPVARAWIEYQPEGRGRDEARLTSTLKLAAFLGPLGARQPLETAALLTGGQRVWGQHRLALKENGTRATTAFIPWVSGEYSLCMEDDIGVCGYWSFAVQVQSDPVPRVQLKRPSASLDSLMLLPQAEVTVQAAITDEHYAIRSAFLEYRCKDEKPQRRMLYHFQTTGAALSALAVAPGTNLRLRQQQLNVTRRLSLKQILHSDGRPLKEGDIVLLAIGADDFDNVAVDKKPGRSHEVELRIVGRPALEAVLNQVQAQVQQELLKLREQEREAIKKVADAEKEWRHTGKLRPQDIDNLPQVKTLQEQIRARVGTPEEGLRAEVNRALQTMRDNEMPRSETQQRLETVADELERLAREELEQVEPLLTGARKEQELATKHTKPEKGQRGLLSEALDHQEEVERTLSALLREMEPGTKTREVKSEAQALLQEQRKLAAQTDKLSREMPPGRDPGALQPEQAADLERAAEWQDRLADHLGQLLGKMDRVKEEKQKLALEKKNLAEEKEHLAEDKRKQAKAEERKNPDKASALREEARALDREAERLKEEAQTLADEAKTLKDAAEEGRKGAVASKMKEAADSTGKNQLGKARTAQKEGTRGLEEVVKALEQRREKELDQLIKKLKEAEKEMARLSEEQEKLQKKVKDAEKIKDRAEREQELQRLGREQEKLRKDAQEMVRQLTRLRAERARDALSRAGGQMEDASQQLERGQEPEEQQDEALDRLDDARQELQRAREEAEEELAREKLAKVADQLRRLKERQEALLPEADRIQREVLDRKGWGRGLLTSLGSLADAQEGLAEETRSLAEGKLKDALVFTRLVGKSADDMDEAVRSIRKRFQQRVKEPEAELDAAAEEAADREAQGHMRLALQRLEQLLEALKPEKGMASKGGGGGGGGSGKKGKGDADGIPQMAQFKALKALQEEINQRTEEFSRKHPDAAKLNEKEKKELDGLRRDQAEVADLLQELTGPADEGGKP